MYDPSFYGADVSADGAPAQHVGYGGNSDRTWTNPQAGNLADGVTLYFGSDDNLDFGEHDHSTEGYPGPSDGGSWEIDVRPAQLAVWVSHVTSGDLVYLSHNPVPVANFHLGMGADGHDAAITTNQRTVYQGSCQPSKKNPCPARDAADYQGMKWDPSTCAGPSDSAADCTYNYNPKKPNTWTDLGWWDSHRGTTYAEPGVQVYEDPDPQGSPEPDQTWPQPAAAVTTCGVYAGGGAADLSGAPATNDAGQVQAENPNCADTNDPGR